MLLIEVALSLKKILKKKEVRNQSSPHHSKKKKRKKKHIKDTNLYIYLQQKLPRHYFTTTPSIR